MSYSFNLIDCPWIPCIHLDGRVELFSLRQTLLNAHQLRGVQGDSPLETAAIYRLLLAVLHSTLRGPRSTRDWSRLWQRGFWEPEQFNTYLNQWRGRFDLFDSVCPFYQAADERAKPKSVHSLVLDMASGNNGSLFDHHIEADGAALTAPKAARVLLTAQAFSLAGLSGMEQKFTDAPWSRGIIFLVEGDTLFASLCLNLLRYPEDAIIPSRPDDCPAWEQDDPHQPKRQIPTGYLDYLTWQNRRILLRPEGPEDSPLVRFMTMAPGLRLDAGIQDPMKLYRTGKEEGYIVIRFSEDRALWRDSASLFSLKTNVHHKPPQTFTWLADLTTYGMVPREQVYRFMALGMANDQAKIEFFQEEHLPLPLVYLENSELVESLSNALDLAEKTSFALRVAGQWLALLVTEPMADDKTWKEVGRMSREQAEKLYLHWNVDRYFWQPLEIAFLNFLQDLPVQPEALQNWKNALNQAVWETLEHAVELAGDDAAALKAAVRAREKLRIALHDLYPNKQ